MFVYVVEDDENMSDLECYTLTNNGYEVKPLYTAKEFEQELKKRIPDMIFPYIHKFDIEWTAIPVH